MLRKFDEDDMLFDSDLFWEMNYKAEFDDFIATLIMKYGNKFKKEDLKEYERLVMERFKTIYDELK